jgi:hypothetical protein
MDQEKLLNERILAITQLLNEKYPELTKYVPEMTETNPDEKDPEINRKILKDYYDSLVHMIRKYNPDYKPDEYVGEEK